MGLGLDFLWAALTWPDPPWAMPTYLIGSVLVGGLVGLLSWLALKDRQPDRATKRRAVILVIVCTICWFAVPFALAITYWFDPDIGRLRNRHS